MSAHVLVQLIDGEYVLSDAEPARQLSTLPPLPAQLARMRTRIEYRSPLQVAVERQDRRPHAAAA